MKHIKHIFFDLDNTLWDFEKNSREALLHLFTESDISKLCNVSFESFIKTYENINHHLWHQYSLKQIVKEELRYQRFYQTFKHYHYDNIELAKQWADEYLTISPYKTHLIEGAIETLNYLQHKYTLHLITNGFKEVQHIKLDCCGLKPFFNHLIISEDHGYNKPDIKLFQIAENLANTNKNECVMIGDNYEADIIGALNAGWDAIYLSSSAIENPIEKLTHIEKLIELKDIF